MTPHSGNIRDRFFSPETSPSVYLSKAAHSLKTDVYVVLEDILLDSTISIDIDLVLNFFASKFGGVGLTAVGDPWSNIYNTGNQDADDRANASRLGRMTVPARIWPILRSLASSTSIRPSFGLSLHWRSC
jgi:hypothetical protein